MKIVSIALTVLFLVFVVLSFSTFQMWYSMNDNPLMSKKFLSVIETRMLIDSVINILVFIASLVLTIKKKYKWNCILFGCFILLTLGYSIFLA
jgi:hypothetical protein